MQPHTGPLFLNYMRLGAEILLYTPDNWGFKWPNSTGQGPAIWRHSRGASQHEGHVFGAAQNMCCTASGFAQLWRQRTKTSHLEFPPPPSHSREHKVCRLTVINPSFVLDCNRIPVFDLKISKRKICHRSTRTLRGLDWTLTSSHRCKAMMIHCWLVLSLLRFNSCALHRSWKYSACCR